MEEDVGILTEIGQLIDKIVNEEDSAEQKPVYNDMSNVDAEALNDTITP